MNEAPVEALGQKREGVDQIIKAFFRDRPTDRENHHRAVRVAAIRPGWMAYGRAELLEIKPVIAEAHRIRTTRETCDMAASGFGTGDDPRRLGELYALFPLRQGPDVFGMRGSSPVEPGHQPRVAGDRGWC